MEIKVNSYLKVTAASFAALCFSTNATAQQTISWSEGTIFTFAEYDGWKKEIGRSTVIVKEKTETGYKLLDNYGGQDTTVNVSMAGVYSRPKPRTAESFEYAPVKLPIEKGSVWDWTYYYIGKNTGMPGTTNRKCEAETMEDIEVPAGKFKAWKITCRGSWQNMAGSNGTNNRTMWFSPELSLVVKTDERSSYFGGSDRTIFQLESIGKQ
jgi:hypothetical protein